MTKDLRDKAIDIKGKKYVLVSDRVVWFTENFPHGSITTELISSPTDELVIIKATIKPRPLISNERIDSETEQVFTAYSQAKWGDGYINKTSALENAETSAVGRALAFMGIGVIESIASADEIHKATTAKPFDPIMAKKYERKDVTRDESEHDAGNPLL